MLTKNNTTRWLLLTAAVMSLLVPAALAGKGKKVKDTTAPDAVVDLVAETAALGSIALSFTAVGDDGQSGTAATYDVRYATSAILSDADFDAATPVAGEPDPHHAGSTEHVCVPGLAPGTTYYAALKVADEAGNVSGLSNSPSAVAGASLGDYVHVKRIGVWATFGGGASRTRWATVTVVDENGGPVAGATVTGEWTTDGKQDSKTYSGVTDCRGVAEVPGSKFNAHNGIPITFTVTDITHSSAQYDPAANVVTSRTTWVY